MALLIVLVVLSGALLAPGLLIGPSLDAAVFSHVGGRLLDGVAPYVGAWDHKPPGIYLAGAAAHGLLGWTGTWTADWLLSVAATAGIGAGVAAVLARLGVAGWPRGLAAGGATILAGQYLLALGGGLTEAPGAFLMAWALLLALGPASTARALGSGALVAMALLLSLQLLPGGLIVLALAVVLHPAPARLRAAGGMAIGAAIPVAFVAGWLVAIGAMPAAIDAVATYSAAYRGSGEDYGAILAAPVASWTVLASLFLITPALLGAASVARIPQPGHAVGIALLVWIGTSLILFLVQGRFYAHYAIPLAVPLGVLAGLGLQRVAESLRRAGTSRRRAMVVLPLLVTLVISTVAGGVSAAMELAMVSDKATRTNAVAERIEHLPGATLLVWGNEPRLYDLTGRSPATRYSYLSPLTTPGYSTAEMVADVLHELTTDPPAVVVDAGSDGPGEPGFLPLLIDRPIATDGRDLDLLDPLRAFIAEHYVLIDTVAGWPIYVLGDDLKQ
ncbi:MAG: hypothetical protein WED86_03790 [Chloroflexota bacterium]